MQKRWLVLALGIPALLWAAPAIIQSSGEVAFAQNHYTVTHYYRSSHDQAIIDALKMMRDTPAQVALDKILTRPARVIFKDLGQISKKVRNYDALSWLSSHGELVIYLNAKHQNAPPEALAAIIAHEALHDDPYNSIPEEVAGWTQEAVAWHAMKQRNPRLAALQPGEHPLVDRLNKIEMEYNLGTLEAFVRSNPGYQGLPSQSPGFPPDTAVSAR